MSPDHFKKAAMILLILVFLMGTMGCFAFRDMLDYTMRELGAIYYNMKNQGGITDQASIPSTEDTSPPEEAGQAGITTSGPLSAATTQPQRQKNVAACDALPYVKVEVADRFVPFDNSACYQDMSITNTHPDKTIWVIGHLGADSEGKVLGEFQDFRPQEQSDEIWSHYNRPAPNFPGSYSIVDWYVAVFSVPECWWIIEEYVRSDFHSTRIVELPSLGLAVQYVDVPSCSP